MKLLTFASTFGPFGAADEFPWKRKIFESGVYPFQMVDASNAYLDQLVKNFKPVGFNNSHFTIRNRSFRRWTLGAVPAVPRIETR